MRLDGLTILVDLQARLDAVTEEQIEIIGQRLSEPAAGEQIVGGIERDTKRLHTLVEILTSEIKLEQAKGLVVQPESVSEDHNYRAVIADQLRDVTIELVWAQARADTGFWKAASVGVRRGWVLVELKEPENPMEMVMRRFGIPGGRE